MRVLLWNCNNGLGRSEQVEQFHSFHCDIAIIPELKEHNLDALEPEDSVWVTNNQNKSKPKGLGVLAYNKWRIESLPRDEDMEIYLPLKLSNDKESLFLLAVWNFYHAAKAGRFKGVRGENALEWSAIRHYRDLLADDTLVIGDWNFGPTFSQEAFQRLVSSLKDLGLLSLYHQFYSLPHNQTQHTTFRTTRNTDHHLDHIFGSEHFARRMLSYEILPFEEVVLSDHAPCILEFKDI